MSGTKLAFVRLGALGDVVRLLPLAEAAKRRWAAGSLLWVAGPGAAPLVRIHGSVDEVFEVPRPGLANAGLWLRRALELRRREVDVCFDLQGLAKSGFWTLAMGAPRRIGLGRNRAREGSSLVLTERLEPRPRSRYEEALELLNLGWEDWHAGAADLRRHWGVAAGPRRGILLHPGGSARNRHKRWPAERYVEAAEQFRRRTREPVLIHFGAGEQALAEGIAAAVPGAIAVTSESAERLVARIGSAALFVGGDTGPLHVALLCGTPAVAVYGASDPQVYALPPGTAHRVVREPVPCSPCRHRNCQTLECLEQLQAHRVVEAGVELMAGRA